MSRVRCAAALAATVLVASCGGESSGDAVDPGVYLNEPVDGPLEASNVACSQAELSGDDDAFDFVVAYPIADGALAAPCLVGDDESAATLAAAWASLQTITPPGQLSDLGMFAGFVPGDDSEADTLAFVNTLDADGEQFQMSVNLDTTDDEEELLLTLAHELTHIFTATPSQLDRSAESEENCETYDNGEGCYLPDALLFQWVERFWEPDVLAEVDPFGDPEDEVGARCDADAGYFGSYAATNPEEDFAEAFSAFVFDLEPTSDGQAERLTWIGEQPGLAEFRSRAEAAGLTPIDNFFDRCG